MNARDSNGERERDELYLSTIIVSAIQVVCGLDWGAVRVHVLTEIFMQKQWQGGPKPADVNDVKFTLELLDHLGEEYCIDTDRVYSTGKSDGGGLTNLLACDPDASKRIAAFASVSGAYYQNTPEDQCDANTVEIKCKPGRTPIPFLEFHGDGDTTIPYDGGGRHGRCLPTVPHFVQEWAQRDGLGLHNKTTQLYDNHVQESKYGKGAALGTVTHYRVDGLAHDWPSTKPNDDNKKGTYFNATPIILDFFSRFTLSS